MLKTIALIGLAAALVIPSVPAFAVSGNSSSYGTEGYGPTVPTQSLTPFQRSCNHANESKERARAGAAWFASRRLRPSSNHNRKREADLCALDTASQGNDECDSLVSTGASKGNPMLKTIALIGLAAALAFLSGAGARSNRILLVLTADVGWRDRTFPTAIADPFQGFRGTSQ